MNSLTIIGNLTKDPTSAAQQDGTSVCRFTVAVNKPKKNGQDNGADFFSVTTWRQQADNCARYLRKGSKVCVMGSVSINTYQAQDGSTRASMSVSAVNVEFLSTPNTESSQDHSEGRQSNAPTQSPAGFTAVETDELPF